MRGALPVGDPQDLFRIEVSLTGQLEADLLLSGLPVGTDYDVALFRAGVPGVVAEPRSPGLDPEYIYVDVMPATYYRSVPPAPTSQRSEVPYQLIWLKR